MPTFEVLSTLLTAEYRLLSKHFQDLVALMTQISTNTEAGDET
jgi:hypothetical protein